MPRFCNHRRRNSSLIKYMQLIFKVDSQLLSQIKTQGAASKLHFIEQTAVLRVEGRGPQEGFSCKGCLGLALFLTVTQTRGVSPACHPCCCPPPFMLMLLFLCHSLTISSLAFCCYFFSSLHPFPLLSLRGESKQGLVLIRPGRGLLTIGPLLAFAAAPCLSRGAEWQVFPNAPADRRRHRSG